MKTIALLGSTGSIGTQTLEIVREQKDIRVASLAVLKNIDLLERQTREFLPDLVCVYDEERAEEFRSRVSDLPVKVLSGMDGLIEAACVESAEITVPAVVGMIGIRPTMEAIRAGKDIALANKETLVTAGHLIMPMIREYGVKLLPVDSEHSALFQCLQGRADNRIAKIHLTASGGPFRGFSAEQLQKVTLRDALQHPNWSMGQKITIDSATMVNKGLEIMEAHWLFDVSYDQIEVVVQPKSIIHSMVEFEDGAVMAQLGTPDMKLPIQYALYYPERRYLPGKRLDFSVIGAITVEKPDTQVFRALPLAVRVGKQGGNAPTVFNAANEWAVARFLREEISFPAITEAIELALSKVPFIDHPSLPEILDTEKTVYEVLNCQL